MPTVIICVITCILFQESLSETTRRGRLLGGGGIEDNFEIFDCPCGCHILSIQGSSATQFLAADDRCDTDDPPDSKIGGHSFDCPCSCAVLISSNTTAVIYPNNKCWDTELNHIDGVTIDCPCSCNGTTPQGTIYEIPRGLLCPLEDPVSDEILDNEIDYNTSTPDTELQQEFLNNQDDFIETESFKDNHVTKKPDSITPLKNIKPEKESSPPKTNSETIVTNPKDDEVILTKPNNKDSKFPEFQKPSEEFSQFSNYIPNMMPISLNPFIGPPRRFGPTIINLPFGMPQMNFGIPRNLPNLFF